MIIRKVYVRDNIPMFEAHYTAKDGEIFRAWKPRAFDAACSAYAIERVTLKTRQKLGLRA